jgi:hypothetical protein
MADSKIKYHEITTFNSPAYDDETKCGNVCFFFTIKNYLEKYHGIKLSIKDLIELADFKHCGTMVDITDHNENITNLLSELENIYGKAFLLIAHNNVSGKHNVIKEPIEGEFIGNGNIGSYIINMYNENNNHWVLIEKIDDIDIGLVRNKEYVEIASQFDLEYNVFSKVKPNSKVNIYIFTKYSRTNTYFFGCVRNIYDTGRVNKKILPNTKINNYGKWTCIESYPLKKSKNYIDGIIPELNKKLNINIKDTDIDLSKIDSSYPENKNAKLVCHMEQFYPIGHNFPEYNFGILIFEMNENDFFNIFPLGGNYCKELYTKSSGEIDAIQAFSHDDMLYYQNKELQKKKNYFTEEYLKIYNRYIIPGFFMFNIFKDFELIKLHDIDVESRIPTEFLHEQY